jgi:hypothetical protein
MTAMPMTEDEVLAFAAASMSSLWTLELLLLMRDDAGRLWAIEDLIRELRSSSTAVTEGLAELGQNGLVIEPSPGEWRYQPVSDTIDRIVGELAGVYRAKPAAVIRAIVTAPNRKLQILSDAFKIKE